MISFKHRRSYFEKIILFYFRYDCLIFALYGGLQAKEIVLDHSSCPGIFWPQGGCTDAIVGEISKAQKEVLVQAYSFTSKPIAKALVDAHKRGVHTEIILDKSQRGKRYHAADFCAHMGIPTYIDFAHAHAHNKVMLIDQETVITGSFNFTKAAEERNAENLLIIKSRDLAKEYLDNWEEHKKRSEKYEGR